MSAERSSVQGGPKGARARGKEKTMKERSYSRLTKAERASLERGLDRGMGYREIARAFLALSEEICASACEMDTVIGLARDKQCVLTLYLRPCKFQALMLLPEQAPGAVAAALGSLERSTASMPPLSLWMQ